MSGSVYDDQGRKLSLGSCLGIGGEGAVYSLRPYEEVVAKIYKERVSDEKRRKLEVMVRRGDPELAGIAAWPMGLIKDSRGMVIGFSMPRVAGFYAAHMLYGPAHRKTVFPDANWSFLVRTARNIAACFDAVHRHGHVVGDVNQGNVLVSSKAMARLIDCDSFQITDGKAPFLCDVGVPLFTPPELQGRGFRGLARTPNHDNFGLAVLCFHLLFLGRHPFVGIYQGSDIPPETNIQRFGFAFGARAASLGMRPPPQTVGLSVVPAEVARLFERAFGPEGVNGHGRPTAGNWVNALDSLGSATGRCSKNATHWYWRSGGRCPWCELEELGAPPPFISWSVPTSGATFDIVTAWTKIVAVPSPGTAPPLPGTQASATRRGRPLPESLSSKRRNRMVWRVLGLAFAVGLGIGINPFLGIVLGIAILAVTSPSMEESAERTRRQQAHALAQSRIRDLERNWQEKTGDGLFQRARSALQESQRQYAQLDTAFRTEYRKLDEGRREAQLGRFLQRYSIDEARIEKIGPVRTAILASFGIETACDVKPEALDPVSGFGPALKKRLLDWRASVVRRFVFDVTQGIHPHDLANLQQRFAARKAELERELREGPTVLDNCRKAILRARAEAVSAGRQLRNDLAQASADLRIR